MKHFSYRLAGLAFYSLFGLFFLSGCGSDNSPLNQAITPLMKVNNVNGTVPENLFTATLTGSAEVPPVTTNAAGTAVAIVDPATLMAKISVVTSDLPGTSAHVHAGAKGVTGPIVLPLSETTAGSGIWTATATLTTTQMTTLKAGNYYVNVHSAAFPDGEIRGQLLAQLPKSGVSLSTASSAAANPNKPFFYTNILSGSLVVPATSSTAKAASIAIYRPQTKSLTTTIISSGITGTAASVRQAVPGSNGPLVASLLETSAGSGIWTNLTTLTDAQITALNAGGLYDEITSTAFPAGELRGQIVKSNGATKIATSTPVEATTTTTGAASTPVVAATTTATPVTTTAPGTTGTTGTTTGTGTGTTGTTATAGTTSTGGTTPIVDTTPIAPVVTTGVTTPVNTIVPVGTTTPVNTIVPVATTTPVNTIVPVAPVTPTTTMTNSNTNTSTTTTTTPTTTP